MDPLKQIKLQGYCHLPQVYSKEVIDKALKLVKDWHEKTKDTLPQNLPNLAKDPIVWNLQNKDHYFLELILKNKQIQEILIHFLNDEWFKQIPADQPNYILRSYLARSSQNYLPMHIDSFVPYLGDHIFAMQVAIPLEDQTIENGCTYIVPNSHLSGKYTTQKDFSNAIPLESKAGDVLIWDSRLWHNADINRSQGTRWCLIGTFIRWWVKQMFNIPANLPSHIYDQLTDPEKATLGFCSLPWNDETQGIDMKRGYSALNK